MISMYEDEKACYVVFIYTDDIFVLFTQLGSLRKNRKETLRDPVSLFPSPYCTQTSHLVISSVKNIVHFPLSVAVSNVYCILSCFMRTKPTVKTLWYAYVCSF